MECLCVGYSTLFSLDIKLDPLHQGHTASAMFYLFFFNRVLESHFQSQKEVYEKEIEGLNHKVEHLSQDINHLQKLFREENDINDGIRLEVSRLTSENLVRSRCSKAKYVFIPVIQSSCLCDTKLSKSCSCVLEISRLKQIQPSKIAHPYRLFPCVPG